MPRPPRVEFPDALFHVTARGITKSPIVTDDHDRVKWCDYLKEAVRRFGLDLHAWALMDNHFHLFVSTPLANLGKAMQYLNGSYAMWFNTLHARSGHLFEKRYHAVLVESEGHYTEVSRYVHLNPVRAGVVKRPQDYAWSSYHGYYSGRKPLRWLNYERVLEEFGEGKEARERYCEFVEEGVEEKISPPWKHARGGWILGTPAFATKVYGILASDKKYGEKGHGHFSVFLRKPQALYASLDDIAQAVCREFLVSLESLKNHKDGGEARRAFVFIAREMARHTLKSIGEFLGDYSPGNISKMSRRALERSQRNSQFARYVLAAQTALMQKKDKKGV
jgi:REP element-mobilizing transposase RayT